MSMTAKTAVCALTKPIAMMAEKPAVAHGPQGFAGTGGRWVAPDEVASAGGGMESDTRSSLSEKNHCHKPLLPVR